MVEPPPVYFFMHCWDLYVRINYWIELNWIGWPCFVCTFKIVLPKNSRCDHHYQTARQTAVNQSNVVSPCIAAYDWLRALVHLWHHDRDDLNMVLLAIFQEQNMWFSWWRHQMETFSALLALCAGNSPVPVNSPHKGQWRGALMFSLICAWINRWVNNREAGDLRRHRGHYDVNVM